MLKWLLYLVPSTFFTILCYLTNFIVVLFCDKNGELNGFWHYWQTWDDSCDSEFFMKDVCPSFLNYGYDEHYTSRIDTSDRLKRYNKTRCFSDAKENASWTTKQKIQRYFCRVWWLTRNCAYGFCFYLLGADLTNVTYTINEPEHFLGFVGNKLFQPFVFKNETKICKYLSWKFYLGWKTYPGNENATNCMLAYRPLIKISLKNE